MFYIVLCAVLLMSAWMASEYGKNIPDCLALCSAGLIICLYVLAFFRMLGGIWVVAVAAIVFVMVRVLVSTVPDRKKTVSKLRDMAAKLADPFLIMFALTVFGVLAATSSQVFTWWDDINYWSSDAKQIFYLGGFPGRYGNVSPEFGDYPPVTSLFKWLFLSLSGSEYRESLQFAGYFALNGVFLMPLLARIRAYINEGGFSLPGRLALSALSFAAVMLMPGVFNGIIYYGTPADITMALIYGALLLAIYDRYESGETFYYVRIALFGSILLLTKNVAFEWAAFAVIFYMLFGRRDKKAFLSLLAAATSLGSWMGFCLLNRRVAKLTGAGLRMATSGDYMAPDNTFDKLKFFAQGFLTEPMHTDHNLTPDLSTGAAVVLIFLGIFFMYNKNILGKREVRNMAIFAAATGLLSYGIVFLAHISIFQTEDQYLDAYAMGISISRYCAPFTLGTSYVLIGIAFNRLRAAGKKMRREIAVVAFAAMILLTADYGGVYKYLVGYRSKEAQNIQAYEDMVGDEGRALVGAVSDPVYRGRRVLVLKDVRNFSYVHNAYISKEASPVPFVYNSYIIDEDNRESIIKKIEESHAEFVLVEDETGEGRDLFLNIIRDYEAGRVYRISESLY